MVQGVEIKDGKIVNTDPATGAVVALVPVSTPAVVESTIAAARASQMSWASKTFEERGALLKAALATLAEKRDELATMIVKEMGKVLSEAKEEVDGAVGKDEFIDLVVQANAPVVLDGGRSTVVRQPMGIVGICSPWNFPADEILLLAIPALVAGNAVVVKPSEVTPLTGGMVVEALQAALPEGLVGLLQGDGAVGEALVAHPDVSLVCMTGSSATGRKILNTCSTSLKRVVLELGGKDPMVVFADADLDTAAKDAVTWSLANCGQVCCAVERIYIEESVRADFEKRVVAEAATWLVGNGFDETAKVGPMVSEAQRGITDRHVTDAISKGAKVLHQSAVPSGGNYHPVTVLSELQQDMLIQREETFGPVVAIAGFDGSELEAVRLSNDTPYGLSASVYSGDLAKAERVSRQIRAGQVGINNNPYVNASVQCPWVGHKGSGFGYHSGPDGWRQFSMPQSLVTLAPKL